MRQRLQAKVVEAEELTLRDSEGRVRTMIGCITGSGWPALQLFDRNGAVRLALGVREEDERSDIQAYVKLLRSNGELRAEVWASDDTAYFSLRDKDGDQAIRLSIIDTEQIRWGAELTIHGKDGYVSIQHDPDGLPHLKLGLNKGPFKIHLAIDKYGRTRIFRTWSLPPPLRAIAQRKLKQYHAQVTSVLVELGDTPEKIEATLTKSGVMPPTDEPCIEGTLIARYLTWHRRLGYCTISDKEAVCKKRIWVFFELTDFAELPPAVRDVCRRVYNRDGQVAWEIPG